MACLSALAVPTRSSQVLLSGRELGLPVAEDMEPLYYKTGVDALGGGALFY